MPLPSLRCCHGQRLPAPALKEERTRRENDDEDLRREDLERKRPKAANRGGGLCAVGVSVDERGRGDGLERAEGAGVREGGSGARIVITSGGGKRAALIIESGFDPEPQRQVIATPSKST